MSYTAQRYLAIGVAVCLAMLGVVAIGNTETLGITPRVAAWLAVLSTGLGTLQGFLPSVRGTDQQPEHIANRIMELTPAERRALLDDLDRRGLDSQGGQP